MKRRLPAAVGGVLGGKITGLPAGFLYKSFATPSLNGQVFRGVRKDANRNCLCNSKILFALKLPTRKKSRGNRCAAAQGPHTINIPIVYLELDILFYVDRDSDSTGFTN